MHVGRSGVWPCSCIENSTLTVHRLETVAGVGKGPADDHAHRIVEIRTAQFVFDIDGGNVPAGAPAKPETRGWCFDRRSREFFAVESNTEPSKTVSIPIAKTPPSRGPTPKFLGLFQEFFRCAKPFLVAALAPVRRPVGRHPNSRPPPAPRKTELDAGRLQDDRDGHADRGAHGSCCGSRPRA